MERRKAENPLPPEGTYKRMMLDLYEAKAGAPGAQLVDGHWMDVKRWDADINGLIDEIEMDAAWLRLI